jgi:hypothetical protein
MADSERNLDDYFSMESGEYAWFPRDWAEDAAAAAALLPVIEKELYEGLLAVANEGMGASSAHEEEEGLEKEAEEEQEDEGIAAEEVCARVGKKPNGEPWLWVCKPVHPSAKPYWQLHRPNYEDAQS